MTDDQNQDREIEALLDEAAPWCQPRHPGWETLAQRLGPQQTGRRPMADRRRTVVWAATLAATAACLALAVTLFLRLGRQPIEPARRQAVQLATGWRIEPTGDAEYRIEKSDSLPDGAAKVETPPLAANAPRWSRIDTSASLGTSHSASAGRLSLAMRVAEASAIVRGKMLVLKDGQLDCEVTRVIYGRVNGQVVQVRAFFDEGLARTMLSHKRARESKDEVREPSAADVRAEVVRMTNFAVGREVILFLKDWPQRENAAVWLYQGMSFDAPPRHPLDNFEKELVEVIKTGAHLRPVATPGGLGPYIKESERVVRARLVKIGEASARWQVSGTLYVTPPPGQEAGSAPAGNRPAKVEQPEKPATISVDLATWRLRAETIVGYRVAQQPGAAVKEEDIQVEYTRLLKDELTPGREAILFIKPREELADGTVCKLIGILYGDADKASSLDQLDKAIREVIAKGEYHHGYS